MPTTIGQHTVATFTSPVNGTTPIDANTVRGNDNTIRTAYNNHDTDTGIHVQSSTLASRPAAGTAGRKWITADAGSYKLWYDDGTRWNEVGNDAVDVSFIASANIVKGDVLKLTGWNNGLNLPELAPATGAGDICFAIATEAVTNGSRSFAVNTGFIEDVNTSAFSVGDMLYPSNAAGPGSITSWFQNTKPTSGNYQVAAYVIRDNSNNGVLFVEFTGPRIVERSDNTASTVVLRDASGNFAAGAITAGSLNASGLVEFDSLKGTGATTVTNILDEDNMASNSDTALATQQSIKAYVDAQVGANNELSEVLANGNTSGGTNLIMSAGDTLTVDTIAETTAGAGVTIDSVLLKDDVVNATDVETGTVSANDGTLAITVANSTGALTLASALADSNLATISTAGKVANSATTADSANTASAIVARDGSGNFSAGTISAALSGNVTSSNATITGGSINGTTVGGTTPAAGAFTTLTASSTATLNTLSSSGATITGGSINGTAIGGTTPAAGTFSTLSSANATLTGGSINGTPIGGTTASTGAFTTVSASTSVTTPLVTRAGTLALSATGANVITASTNGVERFRITSAGNVGIGTSSPNGTLTIRNGSSATEQLIIGNSANTGGRDWRLGRDNVATGDLIIKSSDATDGNVTTERMRIDSAGNVGIGATPAAWAGTFKALDIGRAGSGSWTFVSNGHTGIVSNGYNDNASWRYASNGQAAYYDIQGSIGAHLWFTAPSGTAGNAISFTQAMTLDASGNLSNSGTYATDAAQNTDGQIRIRNMTTRASGNKYGIRFADSTFETNAAIYVEQNSSGSNSADLIFGTNAATGGIALTSATERARITSGGSFKIGGTADRATTEGDKQLVLFDGTAPVGTLANGVSFYSASGEANVMDAAGNATLLSPHDAETNEWIFRSKHTPTGKVLKIDVERLLKFVNDHFGLDAVHEFIEA